MKNLVILILTLTTLFSNYTLRSDYTFSSSIITARDLFPSIDKNIFIYKAPKDRFSFYVNANDIEEILKKYGIAIEKDGVRRVKFTHVPEDLCLQCISDQIMDEYINFYPSMIVENVYVYPKYELKELPENYSILFRKSDLRRSEGYFYIEDDKRDKIHFKYIVKAFLNVIKSSQSIRRGEIIDSGNTYSEIIKFDRYRSSYISEGQLGEIVARNYIPKDRELTDRVVEKLKVIERNQIVKGFIRDGSIYIEVEVRALESGGVDDIIEIETPEGAKLRAKVVSRKMVKIL